MHASFLFTLTGGGVLPIVLPFLCGHLLLVEGEQKCAGYR